MTKINSWQCDICKKEIRPGDSEYLNSMTINILIPQASMYFPEIQYNFNDVCINCREQLIVAIDDFLRESKT